MNPLKLDLTLDEVNTVLDALGNLPYKQIAPLFEKIKSQAVAQLQSEEPKADPQ
jgi:hypothetical protein